MSNDLNNFLKSVNEAMVKRANDIESDTKHGKSSHPSANGDNNTQTAKEGERTSEHQDYVKETQPNIVDGKPEGSHSLTSQDEKHSREGSHATAIGHDPSIETGSAKGTVKDTPTDHPASTENSELGGKYASADFGQLCQAFGKLANELCATVIDQPLETEQPKTAAAPAAKEADPATAAQQGYDLASALLEGVDKQAADNLVHEVIAGIVKEASDDADAVAHEILSYVQSAQAEQEAQQKKQATDQLTRAWKGLFAAKKAMEGMPGGGAELLDEATGSEGEPGGAPAGPPMGGPEGPPEGGEGEIPLEQIAEMLAQAGIGPEELMQLLQSGGPAPGGPEGGLGGPAPAGPPMGGPPEGPAGGDVPKEASDKSKNKPTPKGKTASQPTNAEIVNLLGELVRRSRA